MRSAPGSLSHGQFHVVHRAEGNCMKPLSPGHGLSAIGPDLRRQVEGADYFLEKGRFAGAGLSEGDREGRIEKLNGKAWKTRAGAQVEKGIASGNGSHRSGAIAVQVQAGKKAFAKVTAHNLFRITDGGQVDAGVPFDDKIKIYSELREDLSRDSGSQEVRLEELRDGFRAEGREH
jgi:hypothetical protein